MLSILFFIALCRKLSFATSYLDQFKKVDEIAKPRFLFRSTLHSLSWAVEVSSICDERDRETLKSKTPEETCAEKCCNASYFCHSFLVAFDTNKKLNCYTFAFGSSNVLPESGVSQQFFTNCRIRSLYDLATQSDFVTPVREMSRDLIRFGPSTNISGELLRSCKSTPKLNSFASHILQQCRYAALADFHLPSDSEQQTSPSGYLDQKSLIYALKSWSFPKPKYSTHFERLVIMFLKLYGPKKHTYHAQSYYYALQKFSDGSFNSRVLVVSFGLGHYITITTTNTDFDEITYISADGNFNQTYSRVKVAVSIYLRKIDRISGLEDGTTKLNQTSKQGIQINFVDLKRDGFSEPELQQQAAITVLEYITCALTRRSYGSYPSSLGPNWIRDLVTFVLSWVYKVRQSDFEIDNRGSRMLDSLSNNFSQQSIIDVITQH